MIHMEFDPHFVFHQLFSYFIIKPFLLAIQRWSKTSNLEHNISDLHYFIIFCSILITIIHVWGSIYSHCIKEGLRVSFSLFH